MANLTVSFPDPQEFREELSKFKQELFEKIESSSTPQSQTAIKKYLTRYEVAAAYRISLPTLHKHTLAGCPSQKIGKRRLYDPVAVAEFFNSKNKIKK